MSSSDYAKGFRRIQEVIGAGVSTRDGMEQLLRFCAEVRPRRPWDKMRSLDFEGDLGYLECWLEDVLSTEPPGETINAFWFGLINPVVAGKVTCGLYIAGSNRFEPLAQDFDWACNPSYFPEGRYAESAVLDQIYQILADMDDDDKCRNLGEYVLCLGYAALAVNHLCKMLPQESLLGKIDWRAVAVGFDSGDGILLSPITRVSA